MDKLQLKIWDALCELSGEEVARVFTDFYGNQLLDDEFLEYLQEEEIMEE
ncbi:MAG: hypothetical protein RR710_04230 [Oscillospiraceae bacterium]